MLHVLIYIVVVYLIALLLAPVLFRLGAKMQGKPTGYIKWTPIVLLIILPLSPYILVEAQTGMAGAGIRKGIRETAGEALDTEGVVSVKVLQLSKNRALVYVVAPCTPLEGPGIDRRFGVLIKMKQARQTWTYERDTDDVVWSDCGNADGNVFPPYPR